MKKYAKYLSLLLIIPFLASCSSSGKKGTKKRTTGKKTRSYDTKDTNG